MKFQVNVNIMGGSEGRGRGEYGYVLNMVYLRLFLTFALHILIADNLWRHKRALVHTRIENKADLP